MDKENMFGTRPSAGIQIDFKALFMEVLDKLFIIILSGIVGGLITFLGCMTVIPLSYESTTSIYIMPQGTDPQSAYVTLEVGSLLTTDYIEIMKSRELIDKTISYFGLEEEETYDSFLKKVTIENPTDTRLIYITVKDKDPYMARNLAVYLRDTAITAIESGMGIEGITVIQNANLPIEPTCSALVWAIIIAALTMLIISVIIIVRYLMIDKIVSADDIENRLNYVVLGTIAYEKNFLEKGRKE